MSEMVKGFSVVNHVGVVASNLDESVKFYEALAGTKVANRNETGEKRTAQTQGLDDTSIKYTNMHLENINIDLLECIEPESEKASCSNEQTNAVHMCFEVEDIDITVTRLRAIGVESDGEPITSQEEDGSRSGSGIGVAYSVDSNDTDLELIAPKGPFTRN